MMISIANYNFFMILKKERSITIITWINQLAPFVGGKSCVTGRIIHKPYLKKQLCNYLRSLHFHSKLVSWLLFQSRLPLLQRFIETVHPATFSFKIVMFATFLSKLSSSLLFHFFKTVKFTTLSFKTVYFVSFICDTVELTTFFTFSKLEILPIFYLKLLSYLLSFKTV